MPEKAYVDMSDFILKMDRQQSRDSPTARFCPNNPEQHGRLGVHGSGAMLLCGKCDHHEGIVRDE